MTNYTGDLAYLMEETPAEELAFFDYIDDLSDKIYLAMERKKVSKAELAKRMGKSRSWVTQVLAGDKNITSRTLASILHALDMRAETTIVDKESGEWLGKSVPTQWSIPVHKYLASMPPKTNEVPRPGKPQKPFVQELAA